MSTDALTARRPPVLRAAYEYVVLYGTLALFGIGGLLFTLLGNLLYWILPRPAGAALGRRIMNRLFRFFTGLLQASGIVRLDLSALDVLRDAGPCVIAPNHPALLDAVLVVARVPNTVCVMKAAVLNNLMLGGGARLAGYIRSDSPLRMIHGAADALHAGCHVLAFPEGTRTIHPPVNRFKGGFALIAKDAGCAVQAVFIETNSPYLGKGWPVFRKPSFPLEYRVRLGRRFEPGGDTRAFLNELEAYFASELGRGP